MESLITALITGGIAAFASIYASHISNEKTVAVLTERMDNADRQRAEDKAETKAQIERLEKKQDEANNIKVRLAIAEHDIQELKAS